MRQTRVMGDPVKIVPVEPVGREIIGESHAPDLFHGADGRFRPASEGSVFDGEAAHWIAPGSLTGRQDIDLRDFALRLSG